MIRRRRQVRRRRRRVRVDLLLVLVVLTVVAAAVSVRHGSAAYVVASKSPSPVVAAFSRGYLSHLDGGLPAGALPGATRQVRALAGATLPSQARFGRLRLTRLELQYVSGASSAQAKVSARDRRHAYGFGLSLRYLDGAWRVAYLVPVDLVTVLASAYRPAPTPVAVSLVARRFALAYAAFREGARRTLPPGLPTIHRQIAAGQDPLATVSPDHSAPRLLALSFGPVAQGAVAASIIERARGRRLRFGVDLERVAGRWQAWGFPEASR